MKGIKISFFDKLNEEKVVSSPKTRSFINTNLSILHWMNLMVGLEFRSFIQYRRWEGEIIFYTSFAGNNIRRFIVYDNAKITAYDEVASFCSY